MTGPHAGTVPLTQAVAEFAHRTNYESIPGEVLDLGKKSILDGLAVALSGSVSPQARLITDYVRELTRPGPCTLIGTSDKIAPRYAALANGTAMHADDYDDTLQADTGRYQGVHPTAPVLAAVLAAAEERDLSGRQLLTAYEVGVEVACRIFDATHVNHTFHGFHATATCAMLGATVGVANLVSAGTERTRTAIGIAASYAGGVLDNIGTMVKPLHAGRSAESAIIANDLTARGFTASQDVLEAPRGFFMAFGGGHEEANIRGKLGNPWSFTDRGVWLKPFPSCSLSHPALTRVRELAVEHDLHAEDIERIRVRTSQNIRETLRNHAPTDELAAKFSMEFCIAAMLLERKCGLLQFDRAIVNRADIRRTMSLVDYTAYTDAEAKAGDYGLVTTLLEIVLRDGRTIKSRIDSGKGSKANPMSMAEVADKFLECAAYARWPQAKAEQVISTVQSLESLGSVRELTRCLAAATS
jgi:2-methylcitrate dehydratase PrpD